MQTTSTIQLFRSQSILSFISSKFSGNRAILAFGLIFFLIFMINPQQSKAQVYNVNYTPVDINGLTYITGTGSGDGTVGAQYHVVDAVGTIDLLLTIESRVNVSDFLLDAPGTTPERFQPEINSSSGESYLDFRFEFFEDYTTPSTKVNVIDFWVTLVDIDGPNATTREFAEIADFSSYEVDNTSQLVLAQGSRLGYTRVTGRPSDLTGIAFDNTASIFIEYAEAIGEFNLRLGFTGTFATRRQFSVAVGSKTNTFTNAVVTTNAVANDDFGYSNIKEPITVDVLDNDTPGSSALDPSSVLIGGAAGAGLPLVVPGEGTWSVNTTTGEITFSPDAALIGSPTPITYQVAGTAAPNIYSTLATVTLIYQVPNPDFNTTLINVSVSGDVSTNDNVVVGTEYDNESLLSGPGGGVLTLNPDGTYSFSASTAGTYVYSYDVCSPTNPNPPCTVSTLTITVTDPLSNTNPPIANPDIAATYADANPLNEGVDVTINVVSNDQPGNSGNVIVPSSAELVGSPVGVTDNGDGTFTYIPAAGFTGTFTFQYTVEDDDGRESNPATVTVTVYPAGSPNAVSATDDYITTFMGSPVVRSAANGLLANDSQLAGGSLNATADTFTNAGEGALVLATDGSYTFTPAEGFVGTTQFPYTVTGTDGATASATAYFTVSPQIVPDFNMGFTDVIVSGDLSTNDLVETGTTYGGITADGGNPNADLPILNGDGTYTFTTDTPGVYNFTYEVCAPSMTSPACYEGTLTITITDPSITSNPPIANNDFAITSANSNPALAGNQVTINAVGNDRAGNPGNVIVPSTATLVGAPADVVDNNDGTFTYTPPAGFVGTFTFQYTVEDDETRESNPATVTITVYPASSPNVLIAADDYYSGLSTETISTGNVLDNDSQLFGGAVNTVSNPGNYPLTGGDLTLNSDGTFSFTPNPAFQGVTSHTYTAEGTDGASASATIYFTIYSDLVVNPDIGVAFIDESISGSVETNDIAPIGSIYTNTTGALPNATLDLNADGTFTFEASTTGVYTYNIEVCAPTNPPGCDTKTLTITVTDPAVATNPPVANNDIAITYADADPATNPGQLVVINVLENDKAGNLGGSLNPASVTEVGGPLSGLVNNGDGTFNYTPPVGQFPGEVSFQYTVSDGTNLTTATAFITIYPASSPNVVTPADDYYTGSVTADITGDVLLNDTQLDNGTGLAVNNPGTFSNGSGSLLLNANGSFTFTPSPSFTGTTTFIYEAIGTDGATGSATLHLTVSGGLIVHPDINVAFIDETISGDASTNDVVPNGSTYAIDATVAEPGGATVNFTMNPNGTYSFTTDTPGIYVYDIEVCAPTTPPGCETKTLTITVTDPGILTNPPVANTDIYVGIEGGGTNVSGNVLDNDVDLSETSLTITELNGVALAPLSLGGGTLTLAANGAFTLVGATTPGEYSFTYTIEDGNSETATATVYITIYPTGTPNLVIASDDYFAGNTTAPITGNVLTNDTQLSGVAITQVNNPVTDEAITGGELTLGADGSFSFTADPGFFGTTSYVYEAEGTDGATAQATLYITVGRGLVLTFNPACIGDVPYLQFSLQANFDANGEDVIVTWTTGVASPGITDPLLVGLIPTVAQTISSTTWALNSGVYEYSGQVLWPGAAESGGVPTDWPGWVDLGGGNWVYQEDGFSGYRINPGVVISVNPDVEITSGDLGYPPPTPLCASSPSIAVSGTVWNDLNESGQPDFTGIFTTGETGTNAGGLSVVIIGEDQVTTGQDIIYAIVAVAADGAYEIPDFVRGTGYTLVLTNDITGLSVSDVVADPNTIANLPSAVLATSPIVRTGVDLLDGVAIEDLDFGVRRLLNEWTGTTNTDWCTATNWSLGSVPIAGADIRIANTANPPVISNVCNVCINNLTIDSGASLTIPSGESVCVTGTLDSQGTVLDAGNIAMRGTTPQTIIGDFNISNLEIDNPTGVTITTGAGNMVNITESIKLTEGALTTNDNLRLISDSSGDAYFAPISDLECAVVSIIGNVRVQKFVAGNNRAFRFIAHPFNGTLSLQQIRNYVHITGAGLDFNDTGNPSAFWYNTAAGNQAEEDEDTGWVAVSPANIGDWFKGRAVRMLFRGPRSQGGVVGDDDYVPQDVTYELIGEVNLCEQILVGLVRSGNPGDGVAGSSAFNFIGNPYPAAIDLKTIPGGDRTNIGPNYYVWQPRTGVQGDDTVYGPGGGRGGNYVAEPFDGGTPVLGQLATGTGFFVVANINNASITFTEANKLAQKQLDPGAAVTFREDGDIASRYGVNTMQLAIDIDGQEVDRVLVYFDDETDAKVDIMDATKFENPSVNFFTVSEDDYAMAIDRRPWVDEEEYRIPLHILSPAVKFTLTVPDFDMESGRTLQLYDRHLDELITLEKGATYEFEVTDEQASKGHRFDIVMGIEVITSINPTADRFQAFLLPNPAQQQVMVSIQRPDEIADTHVRLVDIRGVMLYETTIKATDDAQISYEVGSLAKGVYLVEITHGKQRIVKRLMVN